MVGFITPLEHNVVVVVATVLVVYVSVFRKNLKNCETFATFKKDHKTYLFRRETNKPVTDVLCLRLQSLTECWRCINLTASVQYATMHQSGTSRNSNRTVVVA